MRLHTLPALGSAAADLGPTLYTLSVPGRETLRWRTGDEQPPLSGTHRVAPYDLEARYCSKRETHWVGYQVHLTETCDPGQPDLITQIITTPATTAGLRHGTRQYVHDLAARDLLPGTHCSTQAMSMPTSW